MSQDGYDLCVYTLSPLKLAISASYMWVKVFSHSFLLQLPDTTPPPPLWISPLEQ